MMFTSKLLALDSSWHLNGHKRNLGTHIKPNVRPPFDNAELREQILEHAVFPVLGRETNENSQHAVLPLRPGLGLNDEAPTRQHFDINVAPFAPQSQAMRPNFNEATYPCASLNRGVFPVPGTVTNNSNQHAILAHRPGPGVIEEPCIPNLIAPIAPIEPQAPIARQTPAISTNFEVAIYPRAIATALQRCNAILASSTTTTSFSSVNSILNSDKLIYVVHQRSKIPGQESVYTIIGSYKTLKEANDRAVDAFMAARGQQDADIETEVSEEGLIMCGYQDGVGWEKDWTVVRELVV
jgi:hypothetical protein